MPETEATKTVKYVLELPKALVERLLAGKPPRVKQSNEVYLAAVFAKGDYEAYLKELKAACDEMDRVLKEHEERLKALGIANPSDSEPKPGKKRGPKPRNAQENPGAAPAEPSAAHKGVNKG